MVDNERVGILAPIPSPPDGLQRELHLKISEGGDFASLRPSPIMKQSLLIVEDDAATCAFLADNLTADGFKVACASALGEGLRAIETRHPSLVLLDLALEGDGGGLDLLDRVRGADGIGSRIDPDLPVIVLTGRATEADRVRGFARGADDYLVKPSTTGSCSLGCARCSGARRGVRSAA